MRIALAADHGGFMMKRKLIQVLTAQGHEVLDLGADSSDPVDYPIYCFKLTDCLTRKKADLGILVCKSGIGMSICANKVKGIRAALCATLREAELSRRHNNANVLVLSANFITQAMAVRMTNKWLKVSFDGGRHARRVGEIEAYERNHWKGK